MTVRGDLDDAWRLWGQSTLFATWAKANPGEAKKLAAYRAGGPKPALATAVGRALVAETAAWIASAPAPAPDPAPDPPPPAPAGRFGGNLAKPLPLPTGTPKIISTVGQLLDARGTGGLLAINGKLTLTGEAVFTAPVAFTSYNGGHRDGILCARNASAGFKINAPRAWVHDLCLGGGLYDGVKLADGSNATDIDIARCLIRDCGEQGVNAGGNATDRIFVRECDMAQLGSRYVGDARYGHGIYTGGSSAKGWTIIGNEFDVQAFAVQLYPNATDCLVAGNTCVRSALRGFAYSSGPGHRFIGNVCHDGAGGFIEGDGKAQAYGNVYWSMKGGYTNGYPKPPGDGGLAQTNVSGVVPEAQWGWLPAEFANGKPRTTGDAGCYAAAA